MTLFSRMDRVPATPVKRLLTSSDEEMPEIQRRILFLLRKQAKPMRLKDISGALTEQCSWCHPALAALMKRQMVRKTGRGIYQVSPGPGRYPGGVPETSKSADGNSRSG